MPHPFPDTPERRTPFLPHSTLPAGVHLAAHHPARTRAAYSAYTEVPFSSRNDICAGPPENTGARSQISGLMRGKQCATGHGSVPVSSNRQPAWRKNPACRTASLFAFALVLFITLCGASTVHAAQAHAPDTEAVPAQPVFPPLEEMCGQMLMVGFRGAILTPEAPIACDIRDRHLGGVILFDYDTQLKRPGRNIQFPAQVRRLNADLKALARTPLFVAVDMEGGKVQRLRPQNGFPSFPSAEQQDALGLQKIAAIGEEMGRILTQTGFNLDFAPAVDVNVNPQSPAIGKLGRSYSADAEKVADDAAAFISGLHAAGVLSCLKHFPGHGSALSDSHLGFTDVSQTWSENELVPYRKLLREGRVDMIMTAHIYNEHLDKALPATLSHAVITGLLRGTMGYDGVVVSDDLQMKAVSEKYTLEEAVRLAVAAGCDILLFGNNLQYDPEVTQKAVAALLENVRKGTISEDRIRESYTRIQKLKRRLAN